jgi:hypothetical protein
LHWSAAGTCLECTGIGGGRGSEPEARCGLPNKQFVSQPGMTEQSISAAHSWRRMTNTRADSAATSTPTMLPVESVKVSLSSDADSDQTQSMLEPGAVQTSRIAPRPSIALCSMESPLHLTASLSTAQQSTAVSTPAIHPLPSPSPPVVPTCSLCPQSTRHLRRRSTLHNSISARPYRYRRRLAARQRPRPLAQQLAREGRAAKTAHNAPPANSESHIAQQ